MASPAENKHEPIGRTHLEWVAIAVSVLLAMLLLTFKAVSVGLLEKGDGVQHYMIARYSWVHPDQLLNHWGKPLFTLLASPFAQLGYAGMSMFNALLAIVTCVFAIRILRSVGGYAQIAFPLLVLLSPQYVQMVMGGMTEVLFGALAVLCVWLLLEKRYAFAAMVVSFMPFSRPEYALFLPMAVAWVIWYRQWKALPWFVTGFVLYGIAGAIVIGDPLWYWTKDPYPAGNDIYGTGDLYHFVDNAKHIFGEPLLHLGLVALCIWPLVHWSFPAARKVSLAMLVLCAIPVLATFALHSLIWWKGMHGSAGLLRVITTVTPLAGLFTSYVIGAGIAGLLTSPRLRTWAGAIGILVLVNWSYIDLNEEVEIPVRASSEQIMLDRAGDQVRRLLGNNVRVHSTHPYIAFRAGLDPNDTLQYIAQYGYPGEKNWDVRSGDLMVWESILGPKENHVDLGRLMTDERFQLMHIFFPPDAYRSTEFGPHELFMFRKGPAVRTVVNDTLWDALTAPKRLPVRLDSVPCSEGQGRGICLQSNEFPFEITGIGTPSGSAKLDEIIVEANFVFEQKGPDPPSLIFTVELEHETLRYERLGLSSGETKIKFKLAQLVGDPKITLYIWNIGKIPIRIDRMSITRDRWTQTSD